MRMICAGIEWKWLASSALTCVAMCPAIALAQASSGVDPSAESASGFTGDEIVVQARRRNESVQDVPLVVNTVTADRLAKLSIREFRDIQALVPGLSLNLTANGQGAVATLRGIKFEVNSGGNPTIEFYLNDAPVSSGVLFQTMYDIGQIEVLRGPQGTLRGRASPSGSITVTTRSHRWTSLAATEA